MRLPVACVLAAQHGLEAVRDAEPAQLPPHPLSVSTGDQPERQPPPRHVPQRALCTGHQLALLLLVEIQPEAVGLGPAGLTGRFWSENSRYFYYTDAAVGASDQCGFREPPYVRLDAVDSRIEVLGAGPISPDGTMLATWQGNRLGIWPISGGNLGLTRVYTGLTVPGPIAWRPDGSAIAFLISEGSCPLGETDLGRLDLSEMLPIIILRSSDRSFADLVWDAPNRVTLTDEKGGRWRYNFLTHDLWQIAP